MYFSLFTPPGEDGQGGFDGVSSKPCPICDATGYVEFGLLDKDLVKDIKEIKDVVDLIWAKVNV